MPVGRLTIDDGGDSQVPSCVVITSRPQSVPLATVLGRSPRAQRLRVPRLWVPAPSWDQLLSHRLRRRLSPVANAKLVLHLLQVTANSLVAKTKGLGNLLSPPSHRH